MTGAVAKDRSVAPTALGHIEVAAAERSDGLADDLAALGELDREPQRVVRAHAGQLPVGKERVRVLDHEDESWDTVTVGKRRRAHRGGNLRDQARHVLLV